MHLGADAGLPQAATYQDAFRRLAEADFLDRALAERLAAWAGFRNVLAHFYATVNYDRVHDALSEISDLERFAAVVSARLQTAAESERADLRARMGSAARSGCRGRLIRRCKTGCRLALAVWSSVGARLRVGGSRRRGSSPSC
jgi:hypothetical protein